MLTERNAVLQTEAAEAAASSEERDRKIQELEATIQERDHAIQEGNHTM